MVKMIDYLIIGAFTIDNVINEFGHTALSQFGGNAAYGAAGARIWSKSHVGVVARAGNNFPKEWVNSLEESGVDISGVREISKPHGLCGGMQYNSKGDRVEKVSSKEFTNMTGMKIEEFPSTNPEAEHRAQIDFAPEVEDIPEKFLDAKAVLIAPRYYEKQISYIKKLRESNKERLIIIDPGHWYMLPERENDLRILFSQVNVLLPSEVEARKLYGDMDPEQMIRRLADLGPQIVVMKLGKDGCIVYEKDKNKTTYIPVYPVTSLVDPTGAGDSFCGGFLVGLYETGDPVQAALYGTVSSSFIIEGFGVESSLYINRMKAEERLNQLQLLIQEG